jgi:hypothetical protein
MNKTDENKLEDLIKQKDLIGKQIEELQDKIFFDRQKTKTDYAESILNQWKRHNEGYLFKIEKIIGNSYYCVIWSPELNLLGERTVYSTDFYPEDLETIPKEELKTLVNKHFID